MTAVTTTTTAAPTPTPTPAGRVSPLATLRQTMTLAWRSLVQIKHNPWELLDLSIQPIMFLLLFTYVFGGAISGSTGDYLQFALPGLLVQNALFYTLSTAIGLNTDITKGVFDRLRSLPIARTAPLSGRILADTAKQVWAFALLVGFGMVLGFRVETSPLGLLGALALLVVVALAMSWMSVLIGLKASSPEKVQMIAFSTMMPLTFTSSALVPSQTFPGWLEAWSDINPVTHLADAIRGLLIGGDVAEATMISLLWAAGFAVVFAPLAIRAFRSRV
ncbi:transport permease protein [Planobispora rosea]|uniref:Transport permease protein n=1 Tax=Planobispora rosea TaxID=35762 RepID=A0A8J3RXD6_PLARO|nr:ABC transporter permease [Planobispora rosea]GGS51625.1 transport permease protein [Planobispora rosea]GIH82949.1 transport permease protein [Planobispora rosea]